MAALRRGPDAQRIDAADANLHVAMEDRHG
jgi:hypothetical protein